MSTPTPRTDENSLNWDRANHPGCDADFARTLETELTAANARIAELEKTLEGAYGETTRLREQNKEQKKLIDCANKYVPDLLKGAVSVETLTRQLSESQDSLRKANLDCASFAAQLSESQAQLNCCSNVNEGAKKLISNLEAQLASAREQLDWQNIPNRREPVRGGYEFYVNEEWTGIRDATMGEDPGFSATLMKVRYDPDDERVRIRRVLDDDALLADLASAREDSERLSVIEEALKRAGFGKTVLTVNGYRITNYDEGFHVAKDDISEPIIDECDLRSAIDTARGVSGHLAGRTSPPASAEPGPASTSMWSYSFYRATLCRDGKPWAIVSPDGRNKLTESDADLLLRAMNGLPPSSASTWQPIETAPKDGTRILVSPGYEEETDVAWFGPDGLGDYCHYWNPTQWQPLPPPPTQDGKEQGK